MKPIMRTRWTNTKIETDWNILKGIESLSVWRPGTELLLISQSFPVLVTLPVSTEQWRWCLMDSIMQAMNFSIFTDPAVCLKIADQQEVF